MDPTERKKREPPDSDDHPQLKKQNSTSEVPNEPLDPKDITLIRYQNREMHIRIRELRGEMKAAEQKCKQLTEKGVVYDETVSCVHRSWDQLNSGLQLLIQQIDTHSSPQLDQLLERVPKMDANECKKPLAHLLLKAHTPLNEDIDISKPLQNRADQLQKLFSSVLDIVQRERNKSERLGKLLIEAQGVDKALVERLDAMEKEQVRLHEALSSTQEQCLKYTNQIRLLNDRNIKNAQTIDALQTELDQAKDEVELLRRKVIKAEFPPFAGVSVPKPIAPQHNLNNSSGSINNNNNTTNVNYTPPTTQPSQAPDTKENGNSALEGELAEAQAIAESRLDEIKKLNVERHQLVRDLRGLRDELDHLSGDRVMASLPYTRLQKEVNSLTQALDDRDNQIKNYRSEISRLNATRRTELQTMEHNEFLKRRLLDKHITDLEAKVSSLTADRTDLIAKLEHQLASTPSRSYVDELKLLIGAKDSDIKKCREECERLRESNRSLLAKEERRRPDKAEDLLIEKEGEIRDLIDRLRDATKAVDDLKYKEKKWAEREHDYKVVIESYQAAPKEMRTMAELRISERRLRDELDDMRRHNDDLRRQLDKYSSRIESSSMRDLERKHVDELRGIKHDYEKRISQIEREKKDLHASLESQKQDYEVMLSEIDNISKSYENMQAQNTRLMQQLGEKEDATTKIIAESMKQKKEVIQAVEEGKLANGRVNSVVERNHALAAEILKCQETTQSLYEAMNKLQDELQHTSTPLEVLRGKLGEAERASQVHASQLELSDKALLEYKRKLEDAAVEVEKEKERVRRLEEDKASLKRRLEKHAPHHHNTTSYSPYSSSSSSKLSSSSGSPSLAEEELRLLKQRMRCSVCNDRTKDTVIARCFHVFCQQCIQTNLQQRKRRCPGCTNKFSESDVHSLYDFAS